MSELVVGVDLGMSGARVCVLDERGATLGSARTARLPADGLGTVNRWLGDIGCAVGAAWAEATGRSKHRHARPAAVALGAFGSLPVLLDARLVPVWTGSLLSSAGPVRQVEAALARGHAPADSAWQVDATGAVVTLLVGRPVMDRLTADDHRGHVVAVPAPEEPTAIAGEVTASAAATVGVAAGTPVLVGTYDSFVDLRAAGVSAHGDAGVVAGSTLVLGAVVGGDVGAPPGLRSVKHLGAGRFVGGWTSTAGSALAWAGRLLATDGTDLASEAHRAGPGAGGLLALAHLHGERAPLWDDRARGVLLGLTDRSRPVDVYRAFVDAVALSAADLATRLLPVSGVVARWRGAGGGLHDVALGPALADALGAPLDVHDVGGGRGAALLALAALGHRVESAPARTIAPDPARHERLRLLDGIRGGLYEAVADRLHALGELDEETM